MGFFMMIRCSFAPDGTCGHCCNALATQVGLQETTATKNGIYYARRCDKCAAIQGGENKGISVFVPIDFSKHINLWN